MKVIDLVSVVHAHDVIVEVQENPRQVGAHALGLKGWFRGLVLLRGVVFQKFAVGVNVQHHVTDRLQVVFYVGVFVMMTNYWVLDALLSSSTCCWSFGTLRSSSSARRCWAHTTHSSPAADQRPPSIATAPYAQTRHCQSSPQALSTT